MNDIKEERLIILQEATERMLKSDYANMNFADTKELIFLMKRLNELSKARKSTRILALIKDKEERERAEVENSINEKLNAELEKQMQPIEMKIKILEVEMILYFDIFDMREIIEEVEKRVFGDEK